MSANFPQPRVVKIQQNTQITYELPHRIFTSSVYPIKSSNGSTVILYGHENGVRVVWRGGRPFKPAQPDYAPKKTNGSENAVISLDSDDEAATHGKFEDNVEFEDEEEDFDPLRPYPDVLQTLDLHFGTSAIHLALLPSTFLKSAASLSGELIALQKQIVFTAACADNSLRLVTLPLTPPSPSSKSRPDFQKRVFETNAGHGTWGETVTILAGHQKPADGLSMTVQSGGNPMALSKGESRHVASTEPSIIVASHSKEVTGLLLVFRVSLKSKLAQAELFQKVYLPSPASCISFNPSSSLPRFNQLLVAESHGICRIYDYSLLSRTSEDSDSLAAKQGTWLYSLYAGFSSGKTEGKEGRSNGLSSNSQRKSVLDAKWVSGGRSVIVLLDDGEWAVWDIEGVAPGASQGLLGRQGIKGGSKTEYSLHGYIESGIKTKSPAHSQTTASKFAPMTPGTRKTIGPFGARAQQSGPVHGQLSVLELPSVLATSPADESVVFRFGNTFALIPSLAKYWATNPQGAGGLTSNPFAGTTGARMVKLEGIDLQGERCSDISQIPRTPTPNGLPSDIVVLSEHRITIVFTGKPIKQQQPQFRATGRPTYTEKISNGNELEDIDRALTMMENSGSRRDFFG